MANPPGCYEPHQRDDSAQQTADPNVLTAPDTFSRSCPEFLSSMTRYASVPPFVDAVIRDKADPG